MGIRNTRDLLKERIIELELDERKIELLANKTKNYKLKSKYLILVKVLTKEKIRLTRELSKISKT